MNEENKKNIILLAGPTASGKSSLALKWAQELGGEIVNADSMQVYVELRDLTARPSEEEEATCPHHLYGVLRGDDPCSAERWRQMALPVIEEIWSRGHVPIVVGGTGLYFKTLLEGLSPVPDIDPAIREQVRTEVAEAGPQAAWERLKELDPAWAARISPTDGQRIARGLEVVLSTGKPLSFWQTQPGIGGLEGRPDIRIRKVVLERDRQDLYARCDLRFQQMIEQGRALEEVKSLLECGYDAELPVMKSLGVPPLIGYVREQISLEEAIIQSQTQTRQFAKRQMTWFRNQCADWELIKMK
ncbi:tRNA (adenosine(37)-N6)-dimethylallyltransferase MiaA [Emcibacter sp.]|uniref:tRNA (adenosine(37)-N6)-dimethylallyltransferase MiaA n=1 Tax=Emcibacter sp. TaxID=1979954 RepID=UPI002AA7FA8D|nr:tRNA (adenosine(37)-N6)-dimethylallyltransferase MiaA [Emcibacter sp.]